MIFSGWLDRRIAVYRITETQGTTGAVTVSTELAFETWAKVREQKGRETFQAEQLTEVYDLEIKIRFRTDIDATQLIIYNDRLFDIHSIQELGRRDALQIFANRKQET